MKLKDMKKKPTKAGIAKIEWADENDSPKRSGNVISLPDNPDNEFIKLKRGKQFLFKRCGDSCWFGGTDENVFLVEITREAFRAYEIGKAKDFYNYLKPEIIKYLEKKFKGVKALRQGDIWAFPLPVSWEALKLLGGLGLFEESYCLDELKARKSNQVLGTRHEVDGKYAELESADSEFEVVAFAEGTLTSADHKPVELEGVYVLAQTNGLADGPDAD